jgi:predicted enzyme related to lactoylglutathione lyase
LPDIVDACERAGRPIVVPITEIRPGAAIAIAEDPDGNWVEFLSST